MSTTITDWTHITCTVPTVSTDLLGDIRRNLSKDPYNLSEFQPSSVKTIDVAQSYNSNTMVIDDNDDDDSDDVVDALHLNTVDDIVFVGSRQGPEIIYIDDDDDDPVLGVQFQEENLKKQISSSSSSSSSAPPLISSSSSSHIGRLSRQPESQIRSSSLRIQQTASSSSKSKSHFNEGLGHSKLSHSFSQTAGRDMGYSSDRDKQLTQPPSWSSSSTTPLKYSLTKAEKRKVDAAELLKRRQERVAAMEDEQSASKVSSFRKPLPSPLKRSIESNTSNQGSIRDNVYGSGSISRNGIRHIDDNNSGNGSGSGDSGVGGSAFESLVFSCHSEPSMRMRNAGYRVSLSNRYPFTCFERLGAIPNFDYRLNYADVSFSEMLQLLTRTITSAYTGTRMVEVDEPTYSNGTEKFYDKKARMDEVLRFQGLPMHQSKESRNKVLNQVLNVLLPWNIAQVKRLADVIGFSGLDCTSAITPLLKDHFGRSVQVYEPRFRKLVMMSVSHERLCEYIGAFLLTPHPLNLVVHPDATKKDIRTCPFNSVLLASRVVESLGQYFVHANSSIPPTALVCATEQQRRGHAETSIVYPSKRKPTSDTLTAWMSPARRLLNLVLAYPQKVPDDMVLHVQRQYLYKLFHLEALPHEASLQFLHTSAPPPCDVEERVEAYKAKCQAEESGRSVTHTSGDNSVAADADAEAMTQTANNGVNDNDANNISDGIDDTIPHHQDISMEPTQRVPADSTSLSNDLPIIENQDCPLMESASPPTGLLLPSEPVVDTASSDTHLPIHNHDECDQNQSTLPFVLYRLLENAKYSDVLKWMPNNWVFQISKFRRFEKDILRSNFPGQYIL